MADKQSQKAGDNSQLVQAQVVYVGIDEKRVREILDETLPIALQNFTDDANKTASQRSGKFGKKLIQRMVEENALTAFSDPAFQLLLIEAQKRAASTEREPDYDLLSEMMVHRFKKGSNRIVRAGISRAVEIVDQISDEALLGITVFHSLTYFVPTVGNLEQGLDILDDLFGKVIYSELPKNTDWLDHLDILDAVRISPIGSMKLLEDYWYEQFDGYLKNGIEENSEKHNEAKDILKAAKLGENCLVKNNYDEKYVKVEVLNKENINKLFVIDNFGQRRKITDNETKALKKIYDLYDGKKMPKKDFIDEIEKHPNLKTLRKWWNSLSKQSIQITSVGKVLAHSNAQRVDKNLPPLH